MSVINLTVIAFLLRGCLDEKAPIQSPRVLADHGAWNRSEEQHFITALGERTPPYVKYTSNGTDRIDMLFTQAHPRNAKTNIYQSNGSRIQLLPGRNTSAVPVEEGTLIYDANDKGRAWVGGRYISYQNYDTDIVGLLN